MNLPAELHGKVCVVTGSNSGIGKAAALQLARAGATVVMVCRSEERGRAALAEIEAKSGNQAVTLMLCDLSSQTSIRRFVDAFGCRYDHLHVLINNAANFDQRLKRTTMTEDGIETIFATNHLGPFLMTNLLLGHLQAGAPSHVLTVASKGLLALPFLRLNLDDLSNERDFSATRAYYRSKLAQILFSYELARRLKGTGVSVNCIRVPNVKLERERYQDLPRHLRWSYALKRRFALTPDAVAAVYVYLTTSPALEGVSGRYFDERGREVRSPKWSYDTTLWQRLWEASAELTGLFEKRVVLETWAAR